MPSIDNVQALSKTFNVSIESLLTPQEVPLNLNKITIFIMIISTMMIILYFVPWQTDWSMTLFISIQLAIYAIYTLIMTLIYTI